ncbi:MAG: anti-sigma factor antagonist [Planctomycetaceae bacterium]|nr:MAG: anti-sigma factor antagonist [Planctomycetaceae bacterium]
MTPSEFEPRYLVLDRRDELVIAAIRVSTLTEDMNLEQFGHELFALVEQLGCRKLVVNMREVQMVTSAGLGKMIALHRKMHRVQGIVVFCHVQPAVEDVLRTSRLITYLNVKADIDEAAGVVGG